MIIVTGGAGFIGSNLIRHLNAQGYRDILVVDNLSTGIKFKNLVDCSIADYLDKDDFLSLLQQDNALGSIEAIFHQGACSATTEWDGRYLMRNNYAYSKALLHYCLEREINFIYASSAAVYGRSKYFSERPLYETPLNVYGYSKLQFDNYVRALLPKAKSQIVGLRYFNVYGPRETHKDSMASVAFHQYHQLAHTGSLKLFAGDDRYADGEQQRDFIYVDDVAALNYWFLKNPEKSGIFNAGTGHAASFNALAAAAISWYGRGNIEYIALPAHLQGRYQNFTEADISTLRSIGYNAEFTTVADGVQQYFDWLAQQ